MSVTANLTTNVETITATIVVEGETIIVQVSAAARGPAGEAGAAGAAGPNTVTTATTTNLSGFISGNGTNISGATAAATTATANTLVLRSAAGGASFGPLSALAGSSNQHSITSSAGTNIVGPLALSGSTGDTLTATYNAAITLNSTTGVNVNGGPLSLTQTWNDAAVTFTGLQVNVTDTASAAASLLMDLRVGGVSRARVRKDGLLTCGFISATSSGSNFASITSSSTGVFLQSGGRLAISNTGYLGFSASGDATGALDLQILRDSANTLAQRNGTAAQESRIYGTYTGPGNYRRLALKMSNTGVAQIVAEGAGTGAVGNRIEIDGLRIGKGGGDVASNTALGASALNANMTGGSNSAVGGEALLNNTTGGSNSAVGLSALRGNTTGGDNSAVGVSALGVNTTGSTNTAVGRSAGRRIAGGSAANTVTNNSVYLGAETKALASGQTNQIVIGYNAIGLGSNTAVLGNDSIVTTALKGNVGIGTTSPASKLTVTGGDVEVTDSASGIILKSPDGTRYRVTVSDLGILSTASVP